MTDEDFFDTLSEMVGSPPREFDDLGAWYRDTFNRIAQQFKWDLKKFVEFPLEDGSSELEMVFRRWGVSESDATDDNTMFFTFLTGTPFVDAYRAVSIRMKIRG